MRAKNEVQSGEDLHLSRHGNAAEERSADLSSAAACSGPPATPVLHSPGEGGTPPGSDAPTLPEVRARLLSRLRSVPARLQACVSFFATYHIDRVSEDDWRSLVKRAVRVAENEVAYYCWREVEDGVLPSGYDFSSVAAQAITEFFEDAEAKASIRTLPALRKYIRRSVRRVINRLHHRMENEVMISECDLDPIIREYGEIIAPLENFCADDPDPAEEAIRNAEAERLEEMKRQVISFLGQDQLLKDLFACLCDGIDKRAAIARRLNISSAEVKNAQKRFDRRIEEFRCQSAPLLAAA